MYKFIKYGLLPLLLLGSLPIFTKSSSHKNQNNSSGISNQKFIAIAKLMTLFINKNFSDILQSYIKELGEPSQEEMKICATIMHSEKFIKDYVELKEFTKEIKTRIKRCKKGPELNTLISLKSEFETFLDLVEKMHNKCCRSNCYSKK